MLRAAAAGFGAKGQPGGPHLLWAELGAKGAGLPLGEAVAAQPDRAFADADEVTDRARAELALPLTYTTAFAPIVAPQSAADVFGADPLPPEVRERPQEGMVAVLSGVATW